MSPLDYFQHLLHFQGYHGGVQRWHGQTSLAAITNTLAQRQHK